MTDLFFLLDVIFSRLRVMGSFFFPSFLSIFQSPLLSFLQFAMVPFIPFYISFVLSHLQPLYRFLRHRLRSMSICIIYFVSDSSRLGSSRFSMQLVRSISLCFEAWYSLQLQREPFNSYLTSSMTFIIMKFPLQIYTIHHRYISTCVNDEESIKYECLCLLQFARLSVTISVTWKYLCN